MKYFVPQGNRLYRWAVSKNIMMRYCLTFGGAALFFAVWYFAIYARVERSLQAQRNAIVQYRKQCAAIGGCANQCEQLQADIDRCNMHLKAQCAKQAKESDGLLFVLEQAKKSHLGFDSYTIDATVDKKWYAREQAHGSFAGSLENITTFLAALKKNDRMVQCKKIGIKAGDERYELMCELKYTKLKNPST
jgi:Tfp pilus assembly protein PilO